jgi:arginase
MDLALATGRGPELLTNLGGLKPLVRDQDVAALGYRDIGLAGHDLSPGFFTAAITRYPLDQVREMGPARTARAAAAELDGGGVTGFWIHLDVDVLDDEEMPAVDSRQPGGLTYSELRELLQGLLASELAVGMHLTAFDPDLDPGGCSADLAALLVEVLKH